MVSFEPVSNPLGEKIRSAAQFPVTCGHKEGTLHKNKYSNSHPCIYSEGQWFTPTQFEQFGGKERNKKWKTSIVHHNVPLQTFIQEGFLSCPSFRQRKTEDVERAVSRSLPDVTRDMQRLKRQGRTACSSGNTSHRKDTISEPISDYGTSISEDDEEDDDDVMALFRGDSIPVKCFSETGTLHKKRFATGRCGKCIRTELCWLTPEGFVKSALPNGIWRRDITSNRTSLGTLIMRKILELHAVNCKCQVCRGENMLDQVNDDECFICNTHGNLVCCDKCPRAFHHHCHTPALQDDTLGEQWICSFCTIRANEPS
ncbi:nuclear body protein SP140-like isoform X2 [Electrophorus electricus]|uniref:Uncharacterized protein n=1 Tax=Electrophorus electricus TaxID=8005 RepID=A0AAY5ECI1_ELEEL|nr:nuclear body protein SP140-like isoform X2 [Electrophorus electricus]